MRTVRCSRCGKAIKGYDFKERMGKLRRHYKKYHPRVFKAWFIKKKKGMKRLEPAWVRKYARLKGSYNKKKRRL